MFLKKLSV